MTIQRLKILFLMFVTVAFSQSALATSIQKLTFEEIVATSELILEAQVTDVYQIDENNLLYTRVVLKVTDVLKGDDPGEFIELDFLGGNQDGKSVTVAGQDIPEEGERGFYFIEDTDGKSVNPLTGWSQGHFVILSDAKGNEFLDTDIKQEVVELTDSKNAVLAAKLRKMRFSSKLVEKAYFSPVTPDELRQAVADILDGN